MNIFLNDPEVMALYEDLKNNKYSSIDDYLTSFPGNSDDTEFTPKTRAYTPERKMFWGGQEVADFEGDNDYGL